MDASFSSGGADAGRRYAVLGSPVGRLWLIADGENLIGCWFDQPDRIPDLTEVRKVPAASDAVLGSAASILARFFDGDVAALDEARDLPLAPSGTAMQQAVWQELRRIPVGQTRSYQEVARSIGRPKAARPVGQAVGRNPISILVPCHRVVGADGSLTGFGGGLERKIELLTREGARL
ncbi:methylated-DNA--[protein]-cysteine S-methyltransferase [Corynebacterium sp. UMB9976]|uniref:methylated-DNA--[protein]-cysteine S-methyltransferase n=1 Tax=Corynebacterium sp. UMB9976 TaxID=3046354 RepID=UPI00254B38C3|nr:methylated-DNA--[protein]-cysteine S-methyltransferase [Corynebacterium sp. UMB9976]MDK6302730.1 methylated-DNA--[protein]-cysteine S-methyltransferase [Corynebacterium sp. UMB9976]